LPWPQGCCEDILGCPEDQLGTRASGAPDTEIVKVGFELRNIARRGPDGRNAIFLLLLLLPQRLLWSKELSGPLSDRRP